MQVKPLELLNMQSRSPFSKTRERPTGSNIAQSPATHPIFYFAAVIAQGTKKQNSKLRKELIYIHIWNHIYPVYYAAGLVFFKDVANNLCPCLCHWD